MTESPRVGVGPEKSVGVLEDRDDSNAGQGGCQGWKYDFQALCGKRLRTVALRHLRVSVSLSETSPPSSSAIFW